MVSLNRNGLIDKVLEGKRISSDEALELYRLSLEELGANANVRRNLEKEKSYGGRGRERSSNPDARRTSYEIVFPMVCRSSPAHPKKISAHQHSRIQSAGVSTFR